MAQRYQIEIETVCDTAEKNVAELCWFMGLIADQPHVVADHLDGKTQALTAMSKTTPNARVAMTIKEVG